MTPITIISAMTPERVIGKNNDLPWKIPEEMAHFKKTTTGATLIYGRGTYSSQGNRALPKRRNIIVSRSLKELPDAEVASSLQEAIEKAKGDEKVFIIGGATIYAQALEENLASNMILTTIHHNYPGDTYFPNFDKDHWEVEKQEEHNEFTIHWYRRKV